VNADEHYRAQWLEQVHHAAKLATALRAAIAWHPDLLGDPYIAETVAEHEQRLGLPRT
jgi:hypothetical protein